MAFATTCPHCKTSFRVVPDQLERSRGLVRCGACHQVFPAAEHLRYFDEAAGGTGRETTGDADRPVMPTTAAGRRDPPAPAPAGSAGAQPPADGPLFPPPSAPATFPPAGAPSSPVAAGTPLFPPSAGAPAFPPPAGAPLFPPPAEGEWDPLEAIGATAGDREGGDRLIASREDGFATGSAGTGGGGPLRASRDPTPAPTADPGADPLAERPRRPLRPSGRRSYIDPVHDPAAAAAAAGPPSQMHDDAHPGADADAHAIFTQAPSDWRAQARMPAAGHDSALPAERRGGYAWVALVVLVLLAALQLALLFRSEIANAVPSLRPAADLVSGAFGMKVEAPRSLAALSIESTELQPVGGSNQASLHALLRNKDERTVRWPAMELTLTDQAGTLVLRKVILPAEYLPASAPAEGLRARSEWPIRLRLDPGGLSLANYSVTLFYP